jgi:hypothetical protein
MMMNWKGFGRKQTWPNLKVLSQHFSGETEQNIRKTSARTVCSLGRDLSQGFRKYEAGVLNTQARRCITVIRDSL